MRWFWQKEEKRHTPLCYDNDLYTGTGLNFYSNLINNTALQLSAVYRAVEIISDAVAVLPIHIKQTNGKHSDMIDHPLNDVFKQHYNLIKMLIESVMLRGNGFAYINRDNTGTVKSLVYLKPSEVTINYNEANGDLSYSCPRVSKARIEPINMIHLVKNSTDGIHGISILSYANRTLNVANASENSAKTFFENGCNLNGLIRAEGQLSKQQREQIKRDWAASQQGNGSGIAVMQGNLHYEPIQVSAGDAQLLESRQFNVTDIARFFGISPVLLGDLSKSSYSTIEATQIDFLLHTLQPYIVMLEDELNRKLLKPSEMNLSINLDEQFMLKGDKAAQASYYSTLLTIGVLCINEVREQLGYSPIEGGDEHNILYVDTSKTNINNNNNDTY